MRPDATLRRLAPLGGAFACLARGCLKRPNLKRAALACACLTLPLASPLAAQNMIAPPIVLMDYGVICDYRPQGQEVEAPDTNAGRVRKGGDPLAFDVMTDQVPALPGVAFGIRFAPAPTLGEVAVTMVTRHPSFGSDYQEAESWPSTITGGLDSARYFFFEFDYELVPGPWSMEVWLDDRMILRQEFTVHAGPAARALLDQCPTSELFS